MTRLHHELILDNIDKFLLFEIDDDFITICELIEERKYIVVLSFCPGEIGAVSEDKTISILPWICRSRVFHDAFLELSHKYLVPFI